MVLREPFTPRIRKKFTKEELDKARLAPSFANVTAAEMAKDHVLANRIALANLPRYYALKEEWLYESGQLQRNDSFYRT